MSQLSFLDFLEDESTELYINLWGMPDGYSLDYDEDDFPEGHPTRKKIEWFNQVSKSAQQWLDLDF